MLFHVLNTTLILSFSEVSGMGRRISMTLVFFFRFIFSELFDFIDQCVPFDCVLYIYIYIYIRHNACADRFLIKKKKNDLLSNIPKFVLIAIRMYQH